MEVVEDPKTKGIYKIKKERPQHNATHTKGTTVQHLIYLLKHKAIKSQCRYKISALGLDKKGDVLGVAFNRPRFSKFHGSIHAEMNLMSRYGTNIKTIILLRVGKSGNVLPVEPCSVCNLKANELGIKIKTVCPSTTHRDR